MIKAKQIILTHCGRVITNYDISINVKHIMYIAKVDEIYTEVFFSKDVSVCINIEFNELMAIIADNLK